MNPIPSGPLQGSEGKDANFVRDDQIILNLRVVTAKSEGSPKITKIRIRTSPYTTVSTLRQALAKEAQRPTDFLTLTFNNKPLIDHRTLQEHGVSTAAQIDVLLFDSPQTQKNGSNNRDSHSVGSKRKRMQKDAEDKMSIVSKRTKLDLYAQLGEDAMTLVSCTENNVTIDQDPEIQESQAVDPNSWPFNQNAKPVKPQTKVPVGPWTQKCVPLADTLKGGKCRNEDAVFTFQSEDGKITSVAVFDGHGISAFAYTASKVAVKITKTWFERFVTEMTSWNDKQWKQGFDRLFDKIHEVMREQFEKMENRKRQHAPGAQYSHPVKDEKGIIRTSDGLPIHGGTTGTVCVLVRSNFGQVFITAYVGDSEVIVTKLGQPQTFELAFCGHRALNKREFNRIKELPKEQYPTKVSFVYDVYGVQDPDLLPKVFLPNGDINTRLSQNPARHGLYPSNIRKEPATYAVTPRSVKVDRVRLANTRSLGDFYGHQFGISHEPEICIEVLPPNESYAIVAASDGVWDTREYREVVSWIQNLTAQGKAPTSQKLREFLHETKIAATNLFRNAAVVDDSSVGVIFVPKIGAGNQS